MFGFGVPPPIIDLFFKWALGGCGFMCLIAFIIIITSRKASKQSPPERTLAGDTAVLIILIAIGLGILIWYASL